DEHRDCKGKGGIDKVSSRSISILRKRNPRSRGSASKSDGKPNAISCARVFITPAILPQWAAEPVEQFRGDYSHPYGKPDLASLPASSIHTELTDLYSQKVIFRMVYPADFDPLLFPRGRGIKTGPCRLN